jgi:hypothetical protein
MLEIELRRLPTPDERAAAARKLPGDASEADKLAAAAPWMPEAVRKLGPELGKIAWQPALPPLEPKAGAPFAVLKIPTTAASVEGSEPRRFSYPEWLLVARVGGGRIVYLDRRFAAQVPEKALTRAPGCPGTEWTLEGPERVPVGRCVAGPHDRRASDLYDPDILRPTGVAHFHEPSIDKALISWNTVADRPVTCVGGSVGRQFYDIPSCQVTYDRAVPQTRSIPADSGIAARSEAHAAQIVDAARSAALFGAELPAHLAHGEVGIGLPYNLYTWAQPELTGCKGRGVYAKLRLVDGGLEFECNALGTLFRFRELTLVSMEAAPAAPAPAPAPAGG